MLTVSIVNIDTYYILFNLDKTQRCDLFLFIGSQRITLFTDRQSDTDNKCCSYYTNTKGSTAAMNANAVIATTKYITPATINY